MGKKTFGEQIQEIREKMDKSLDPVSDLGSGNEEVTNALLYLLLKKKKIKELV